MENKETILELFENYMDGIYERTQEEHEIGKKIMEVEGDFFNSLTNIQKEQLDKINELEAERNGAVHKAVFIFAFSLATKLFVEGLR